MRHIYLIFLALVFVGVAMAHAASEIELSFDKETSTLTVIAKHSVKNASDHYIDEITVELNGKKIITQTFKMQTDDNGQEVIYIIIDAKDGDTIEVSTNCNKFGKKKTKLVVGAS